jgi:outer membrane lipoprotein carrier protein
MNIKLTALLVMIVASTAVTVTPLNAAQTDLLAAEKVVNSASEELKKTLSTFSNFQAQYQQTILSNEGKTLMQGAGTVTLKRPEKLRWQQNSPDETLLVSDGKQTYFYDEFAEQVTILNSQQLIQSTPFALLTSNTDSLWQQYEVVLDNNNFIISPIKTGQGQVERLELRFEQNMIKEMRVIDRTGQTSVYLFNEQKINLSLADDVFNFTIPEGVLVDDQSQGE